MSHWNYRVMNRNGDLAVYSVYYDDDGKVKGWSQEPAALSGPSVEDLQRTIE